jgi:hypothetical protein
VSGLPAHRHGGDPDPPVRVRLSLRRFLQLAGGLLVVGLLAGVLFGRVDPQRAARVVVSEFTTTEDGPADEPGPDRVTPVTGPQRGSPVCGVQADPLTPAEQVTTLAAGVVLLQVPAELPSGDRDRVEEVAEGERVAVSVNRELPEGVAVVATSWRQRMPLDRVDTELLGAFVTGHVDRAPAVADCP